MVNANGMDVTVFITNGQSFGELAAQYTLDPAYGVAIANFNNMSGQDINGQKYRIEIPTSWLKSNTQVNSSQNNWLGPVGGGSSNQIIPGIDNTVLAVGVGLAIWALS